MEVQMPRTTSWHRSRVPLSSPAAARKPLRIGIISEYFYPDSTGGTGTVLSSLARGNVVAVYSDPRMTPPLRALAAAEAGPFTPALERTGQALVLDLRPGGAGTGVVLLAWGHLVRLRDPSLPVAAEFVRSWLGRGEQAPASR